MEQCLAPRKCSETGCSAVICLTHGSWPFLTNASAGLFPLHLPLTDPGPAVFQRPQAPFLRQLCSPASVSSVPNAALERRVVAPLKDARVTQAVPTGTGEPLRTMHTAMNTAPQGQAEGCQDTSAVECPRLPGSWHFIWATQPKGSSTPGGRRLAGLLICLAPPSWATGSWEREGVESLAPRLGISCGIHREDGRPAPSGVRLPGGVAMCQSAEDAPEGSRGPAVRARASEETSG